MSRRLAGKQTGKDTATTIRCRRTTTTLNDLHDADDVTARNGRNGSRLTNVDDSIRVTSSRNRRNNVKYCVDDYLSFSIKSTALSRLTYEPGFPEKRRIGCPIPKFDREKYLLVSCQFVLIDDVDESDPDKMVEWDSVEEVRLGCSEQYHCPICLQPPVAAKITKCGHVYCWSCILHCLALTSKRWCRCPICYEHVYRAQLKTVKLRNVEQYAVGKKITMLLMCRSRNGLVPLPSADPRCPYNSVVLQADDPFNQFGKILQIQKNQLCSIWERERLELEFHLCTCTEHSEQVFTKQALNELWEKERINSEKLDDNLNAQSKKPLDTDTADAVDSMKTSRKDAFFYQANDGQYVFLHSFNVKCLCHEYGALCDSPVEISGVIIETEEVVMDEVLREKYKHLAHIPLGARVMFVELRLNSDVLSLKTMDTFAAACRRREDARQMRTEEEKHLAEKAQRWEESVLRTQTSPTNRIFPDHSSILLGDDPPICNERLSGSCASTSSVEMPVSFAQAARYSNHNSNQSKDCAPCFKDRFASAVDRIFENFKDTNTTDDSTQQTTTKKNRKTKHRILFFT